jgi:tetraacyldisaccharide 4'-kinase
MKIFRKLLYPFAVIYDLITTIRNLLFDKQIFKSTSFDIPIIAVGNLSVGGTGKTPQIEYLIRLLCDKYKVATLSRGYKRNSKGFVLANETCDAKLIGDEPFQFYNKFKNIIVAVDEDRRNGIDQLLSLNNKANLILLDDAFQHRKVMAGFYILLTSFDDLFYDDCLLPAGNLRESRAGAKRANVIVVTKCPFDLSEVKQQKIKKLILKKSNENCPIYFSTIGYDDKVYSQNQTINISEIKNQEKILLAGIAKPKPFFDYLKAENDLIMTFADHHLFSEKEILEIKEKAQNKIIITTEKDYMRLKNSILINQLYYLPIKSIFLSNGNNFDKKILDFIENF